MSDFCVYLKFPEFLSQWFIHLHGGENPVRLLRGSVESKLLELLLALRPEGSEVERWEEGLTAVRIPTFRTKPPQSYNDLTDLSKKAIISTVSKNFDVTLWEEVHDFAKLTRGRKDELLMAWMSKWGIDVTDKNYNAVAKRYRRLRQVYQKNQWTCHSKSR